MGGADNGSIETCSGCGSAQIVPTVPPRMRACCHRCGTTLPSPAGAARGTLRAAAFALAALILYPLAVGLPIVRIEKFGHLHESSVLEGVVTLLGSGHVVIGVIVLLCSVIIPLGKLGAMLALSFGGVWLRTEHRAWTYRMVEWTGRWGMLDVLLVAILVAAVKIGDLVEVTPGPAAVAFSCCVVLSLAATAAFDPRQVWRTPPRASAVASPTDAPARGGSKKRAPDDNRW